MKKKYSFPAMNCRSCAKHHANGGLVNESRYCMGFPKKRNGKRFKRSDPKYKPPKWCPKRLDRPVCRIYGFASEKDAMLDRMLRQDDDPRVHDYCCPSAWRYKLRLELPLGLTAKQFWECVQRDTVESVLSEAKLDCGEVVEIDDGLKPYYFYHTFDALIPALFFNVSLTVKPEVCDET